MGNPPVRDQHARPSKHPNRPVSIQCTNPMKRITEETPISLSLSPVSYLTATPSPIYFPFAVAERLVDVDMP